jgi:hypothetical protein
VKRAVTPKPVKKARRVLHPADDTVYPMQRSVATAIRSGWKGKACVWAAWNLPVNHRRSGAAARCRNR